MKKKNGLSNLFFDLFLFSSLLVVIGAGKNYDSIRWLFIDASNYVSTEGVVTQSKIFHTGLRGGWSFDIVYEYTVNNSLFTSDRVHFSYQTLSDKTYAQGYVDKYPIGKVIVVYYNPQKPNEAVLEPNKKWTELPYYFLTFVLVSFGLLFASWFYKKH